MLKYTTVTVLLCLVTLPSACTYYQTAPGTYTTSSSTVSKFDQSWSAASGAFTDQGIRVTREDRNAGVIEGTRSGITVSGDIRRQADGSVRVQFDTSGDTASDPGLIDRVTRAYQRRMGR